MNKKEYAKQYYLKNKAKLQAYQKEYGKKHPRIHTQKDAEYTKQYRKDHPEKFKAYRAKAKAEGRTYYQKNRVLINSQIRVKRQIDPVYVKKERVRNKKYYTENNDKVKVRHAEYRKNNKTKIRAKGLSYRNIPLDAKCRNCGAVEKLERHHADYNKPLSVITLCHRCHIREHIKIKAMEAA
jgi:hypothetical protein